MDIRVELHQPRYAPYVFVIKRFDDKEIVPTIFELTGFDPRGSAIYQGKQKPQGQSMRGLWQGAGFNDDRDMGFELFGSFAVIKGTWKARIIQPPLGPGRWQLYELSVDPGELVDLSAERPEILEELIQAYERYAAENEVIPPVPPVSRSASVLYAGECNWWCEVRLAMVDRVLGYLAMFRRVFT